jgi:ankyrin repeat protein
MNADITKSGVLYELKRLKKTLFNDLEKCALVAILPATVLESLHDKNIEEEVQSFLAEVQAGEDKTGIVMNVVDGKPQFVHRTFGEYFAAGWFSKNFQHNRSVLEGILFDRTYGVMTDMFNRMLAKDCPLHSAVINNDLKRLDTLLEEVCDVSVLDKGGRTIIHLSAAHDMIGGIGLVELDNMNKFQNKCQYKFLLDTTDSVLQLTPMKYAIKLEKWCYVDWLLKQNVDRSGLDVIRQRADDRSYIDSIILAAGRHRLLLFLEFLCSIGVKISQSSTRDMHEGLLKAIESENVGTIRCMIHLGADCNIRDIYGQTPLFWAISEGSLDIVRTLVEEGGALVDVSDKDGRTVIQVAKHYIEHGPKNLYPIREAETWVKIVQYLEESIYVGEKVKGVDVK